MGYFKNQAISEEAEIIEEIMLAERIREAELESECYMQAANDCLSEDDFEGYQYFSNRASEVLSFRANN